MEVLQLIFDNFLKSFSLILAIGFAINMALDYKRKHKDE